MTVLLALREYKGHSTNEIEMVSALTEQREKKGTKICVVVENMSRMRSWGISDQGDIEKGPEKAALQQCMGHANHRQQKQKVQEPEGGNELGVVQ